MKITIVGLGAGDVDDLTRKAWRALENAETVYLRTQRHPCVPHLPKRAEYLSFDGLYEAHEQFRDVYEAIVTRLIAEAQKGVPVVYAVPGDPMMGEYTVMRLLERCPQEGITLEVISGVSFLEPTLRLLEVDAMNGLQIYDALDVARQHHPQINPALPCLVAQVYSRDVASDVKLTLMNQYPDDFVVRLVHGAGTENAQIETLPLYEIDRSRAINHLTSLFVPSLGQYTSFEAFQETIAHLRAPEGCPWDKAQTHASLRPYLIEEAYETLEAIDADDPQALLGELGDLLLQVVLHAQIATDEGEFQMADVLDHVNKKMIRRHPHVWGDVDVQGDAQQVLRNWDDIKRAERAEAGNPDGENASLLDGVPKGLPALMVAYEYTKRAAKVGFDWRDVAGIEAKVREELNEILEARDVSHKIHEVGDLLFALVNWLRWLGDKDPESLLRETNAKFARRFRYIEAQAKAQGRTLKDLTLEAMDALWDEAKRKEQ
jgi:tetrapyrrole methylase family protein/MazG family protein